MISTYNESSLHESLKKRYAAAYGGSVEAPLAGCVADVAADGLVIEIQTGNFSKLRGKLETLLASCPVLVVYPVIVEKRIVHVDPVTGAELSSRRSPKRATVWELFAELIRIPTLPRNSRFSLEAALVAVAEYRVDDGRGSWRRGGTSIADRSLVDLRGSQRFSAPADYRALIPADVEEPFTAADLARAAGIRPALGQKAVYCLRKMGMLVVAGKRGRAVTYRTA